MPWHPPIPAGKLYSEPALTLGPALALLIWCYDGIQRDGTIEVSLEQATEEIGKSYRTIKDWWKTLRAGPFFSELRDCGRKGWIVRMADEWLDWHTMERNYPHTQGQDVALEGDLSSSVKGRLIALNGAQGPLKARSRPAQGQDVALENAAYKVLMSDQESESHGECEDQDRTVRTPTPAIEAFYAEYPNIRLSEKQIQDICSTATDLTAWRQLLKRWRANQYRPRLGNILDAYEKEQARHSREQSSREQSNGSARPVRQDTEPNPERAILIPASSDSWD